MRINNDDKMRIFGVLAERYFADNNWKFYSVEKGADRIIKIAEDINEQHNAYPSITRDWYVQNGGSRDIHLTDSWDELKTVAGFLKNSPGYFDYFVDTGEIKAFCILSATKELEPERIEIILKAQEAGIRTLVFIANVPSDIEASILQIRKSEC
ncbi:hypothetical protein MmiHf6_02340 [Methanimicrococcus hongohii]|uniref:Uncharacterized protein n=1 Tax=Methanimicrococcus hongohii TaxID=3028295 RepID=A0AA96ZS18_9EURY|nr:hypothetical protein [Methanimicrococcus sp. Hf6]WNY22940.1 hypothetical protein MmiHf6_02340 [Methanimicrococcus sp. Hf6]